MRLGAPGLRLHSGLAALGSVTSIHVVRGSYRTAGIPVEPHTPVIEGSTPAQPGRAPSAKRGDFGMAEREIEAHWIFGIEWTNRLGDLERGFP